MGWPRASKIILHGFGILWYFYLLLDLCTDLAKKVIVVGVINGIARERHCNVLFALVRDK